MSVSTVRNWNVRGHAASWFPGSETSLARHETVTVCIVLPGKLLWETVTVRSRLDHANERPPGGGAIEIALSVAVRFIGSLNVRITGSATPMPVAPSVGLVVSRTGRVQSIVKGPSLMSSAGRPPPSNARTRTHATLV